MCASAMSWVLRASSAFRLSHSGAWKFLVADIRIVLLEYQSSSRSREESCGPRASVRPDSPGVTSATWDQETSGIGLSFPSFPSWRRRRAMRLRRDGFTLIELLVVIAIIAVLI